MTPFPSPIPYVTEVIFSSGRVGDRHWSRFHRFFSHVAWDIDTFSMRLAKLVVTILAPGATFFWAVDDTLCRKRGLTLYGAGMHYDPLISSRAKSLVSWGHDWVVLTLIVAFPAKQLDHSHNHDTQGADQENNQDCGNEIESQNHLNQPGGQAVGRRSIPFDALAVGMEHLAAGGIGAGKNPVRSCH